jgi:hypothetical protein
MSQRKQRGEDANSAFSSQYPILLQEDEWQN